MEEIQYIGETLWPARLGHLAILAGFMSALLAAIAYFFATQRRDTHQEASWKTIGRSAFALHGTMVFTVIGIIFYVMVQRHYEYQYVQAHVSDDLPFRYLFSAFWEGQEGSFLLWMFWHVILGGVLMFTAKKWEAPTLSVLALIQLFISSMLLGLYFGGGDDPVKIGSNPLLLLRDVMDAPIFANADYVKLISGSGLNPLLQNYWMTIHPPTLFLGFASTSIPFCFAIAGLWMSEHRGWLRAVQPWALFSGAILGTGILMGGAWAYEALTFGGYWAWDPVENMSLVPWLILIAGIHTNLIGNSTGYAIRSTYIYYLLTFVLILYSTFLTRSGILGETSVHAFTEMGLEWQLIAFILAFAGIGLVLFGLKFRQIPSPKKEEATNSREFWMFIGSLVLFFSAALITASTSLPVFNKIAQAFDPTFEGRVITEPVPHYNKYQLWIGVFIGLLTGATQLLRYKGLNWAQYRNKYFKHLGVAAALSLVLTFLAALWINAHAWQYKLLLFAGLFAVVANLDYLIVFVKGNLKLSGASLAHIGFGLMLVGILASGLNKHYISSNPFMMEGMIEGADTDIAQKNVMLFKGNPTPMSGYRVTYSKDTLDGFTRTYQIDFEKLDENGQVTETFAVTPNILYDKGFSKIAAYNPSTQRYLHKDVFTHISALPQVEMDMEYRQEQEDNLNYRRFDQPVNVPFTMLDTVEIATQDTVDLRSYRMVIQEVDRQPVHPDYRPEPGDFAIGITLEIQRADQRTSYTVQPVAVLRGQLMYSYPVQLNELSMKIKLNEQIFEQIMLADNQLEYESFTLKQGESFTFADQQIQFLGFNRNPVHPDYRATPDDIAVGANLLVQDQNGASMPAQPVYIIRNNQVMNVKDHLPEMGLHFRFASIDPATETIQLMVAQGAEQVPTIPVEVATNSLRSDFIVLEAIVFPGINFFWLGTVLMMLGLGISWWFKRQQA